MNSSNLHIPSTPGIYNTTFEITLNRGDFQGIIYTPNSRLQIVHSPIRKSILWFFKKRWTYMVKLVTDNASDHVPVHDLVINTKVLSANNKIAKIIKN